MVFSLDPGPLHRPLGVVFGAESGGGVAWIGVERPGAETFALVPPAEVANAAGKWTRARKESASGIVCVRGEVDEARVRALAEAAASAANRPVGRIAVVARDGESGTRGSDAAPKEVAAVVAKADGARAPEFAQWLAAPRTPALSSARGVVDGVRVSTLGIAAGRPLPQRSEGITALLLTDASFATNALARFTAELAERSFGQVAGLRAPHRDDVIVVVATGAAGTTPLTLDALGGRTLLVGTVAVAQNLVQQLLERSAEGTVLVVQITVSGAPDVEVATRVAEMLAAERVAPNAAAGTVARIVAGSGADASNVHANWKRHAARAALRVDLALGRASATRWTAVTET